MSLFYFQFIRFSGYFHLLLAVYSSIDSCWAAGCERAHELTSFDNRVLPFALSPSFLYRSLSLFRIEQRAI